MFLSFCEKYSITIFYFKFWKKSPKLPQLPTIWKGVWYFILSYFEYCQIWLNIYGWMKFELFNVWDIIPINGGLSNHFRCDGLISVFLCYFVWCVHNDRCNCQYDNAQKFDFLVICCYLVASISMHFKSSEPNSKTLFFGK
jgi:hypothetical protein